MSTVTVIQVYWCMYNIVSLGIIYKTVTWRPDQLLVREHFIVFTAAMSLPPVSTPVYSAM